MREGLLAEFMEPGALERARAALRARGYERLEAYSPYPLEAASIGFSPVGGPAPGRLRSRLTAVVFLGGLLGAVAAYLVQLYANVWHYPMNIGARPVHAIPAFIVPSFEGMVIGAAFAGFFGLLIALRLPEPWHPVFDIPDFERATRDRYWLGVDRRDRHFDWDATARLLAEGGPLRVVRLEAEG
ncbi:MAG TPA: DUF3341 domain-containing protein [Gemmatimonadales bacterium]|nr:DUF3341 domain-containing protein [Gemmatimonadales bacterium]